MICDPSAGCVCLCVADVVYDVHISSVAGLPPRATVQEGVQVLAEDMRHLPGDEIGCTIHRADMAQGDCCQCSEESGFHGSI